MVKYSPTKIEGPVHYRLTACYVICCVCLCVRPFTFFAYKKDVISLFFCTTRYDDFLKRCYFAVFLYYEVRRFFFCRTANFNLARHKYEFFLVLQRIFFATKGQYYKKIRTSSKKFVAAKKS